MPRLKYHLPDGKYTASADEYVKAWRKIGRRAEKIFYGYEASAFDPDIQMVLWEKDRFGKVIPIHSFSLNKLMMKALEKGCFGIDKRTGRAKKRRKR